VNHLVKGGRRHLGYVGFAIDTYASRKRYRGFDLAVQNAGLPFDVEKQACAIQSYEPSVVDIICRLLRANPQIDGLMCYNDEAAARALQACAVLGRRVPDDVAVIGYDDIFMADLITPPLTTLDLTIAKQEVGAMAARMLLERIENSEIQQEDVILEHKLIVRDSAP
jgi:DNA-binding LacI/PurR family transcriptional regulator